MPQKKIIRETVAKLQGTDVFHLEPAERKHGGGGWRWREEREKPRETREEVGSKQSRRQEKWEIRKEGEGRNWGSEGASATEGHKAPVCWSEDSTMRIQGKSSNSDCSSSPGQGSPGWVWAPPGPGSQGWEVEGWAVGGHSATPLLLQPRPAVWGAPCLVKQLFRDAKARKKGCIAALPDV